MEFKQVEDVQTKNAKAMELIEKRILLKKRIVLKIQQKEEEKQMQGIMSPGNA